MRFITVPHQMLRRVAVALAAALLVVLAWHWGKTYGYRTWAATLPLSDRYSLRDVNTTQKVAALTFDISWGTVMPAKVVHLLAADHVAATFFLSGPWAKQNPQLVREMVKDGFEIESHGWAHVNYSELSTPQIEANIMKTNQVLEELTGKRPTLVRPPNGDFNSRTILAARAVGYTTVTWGTDSLDWMNPGVATIISRVVTRIHPGDIVLLHASDTCKQTDLALPTILRQLAAKGYRLVTVNQLLTYGSPNYRG
ncbi:MAG: polysaccharide deacetylase family sporulation protein PdaB [Sulfobacillus benefaciens]|uniref:Polysaccharide deacetylase family sporulation protein PdaB n=1 Tax=Sulfobacillus benefaciens TaxID=453960 RepID=A0A2T2XM40_9FIRM|nr:MAG: polysaccharide deacetylase family sporulation protein PdaB [Sulfobacillus benefaciens]